jgi:hypothetical protein
VEASHRNERASREEVPKARSAAAGAAASVLKRAARAEASVSEEFHLVGSKTAISYRMK